VLPGAVIDAGDIAGSLLGGEVVADDLREEIRYSDLK
jgi:hypothetical protein